MKPEDMSAEEYADELEQHLVRNGFIWGPEPEIYGGMAGFYTYGPMGKLVKNKVENAMRRVFRHHRFYEVEAPTIMPRAVWKASGHLDTFVDPLILCTQCEGSFRADKLLEEDFDMVADGMSDEELLAFIDEHDMTCPSCGGAFEKEITDYNLMMKTEVAGEEAYNRPETATTTYLPFTRYWRFFRKKLPIKVFQVGKAFRNEISPRQHVIRGREFTQAEGQVFVTADGKQDWPAFSHVETDEVPLWTAEAQDAEVDVERITLREAVDSGVLSSPAYAWCIGITYELFRSFGIPDERMRFREHTEDEKAHYAAAAWDLEVELDSFGWVECCGVHDRTDFDLKQHSDHSPEDLSFKGNDGEEVTPHILEIAFGTDRPVFALLDIFYNHEHGKLALPKDTAPLDAAVFPLVAKEGLPDTAREVERTLHERGFDVEYDERGSIGKRYARNDAKGTAVCITIDFDTKDDNTVTLRERDTEEQVRVKIKDVDDALDQWLHTVRGERCSSMRPGRDDALHTDTAFKDLGEPL